MKIGVIQLTSKLNPDDNLTKIKKFLEVAQKKQAQAVFLPEVFYSMSDGTRPTQFLVEEPGVHLEKIRSLATDYKMYLLGGSVAFRLGEKIMNRSYNFNPQGEIIGVYDKIHLFSCDLSRHKSQQIIDEAKVYSHGNAPCIFNVDKFKIGMGICFDLRFPELFRHYSSLGCSLLSISSAFTKATGKSHWHALLRARAIENQSFVVASGQWGVHNEKMKTYGHSLVLDPWGDILVDAGEGEKIVFTYLDIPRLLEVRQRISALKKPEDRF